MEDETQLQQKQQQQQLDRDFQWLREQNQQTEQDFIRQTVIPAAVDYYRRRVFHMAASFTEYTDEERPPKRQRPHDCLESQCELEALHVTVYHGRAQNALHICLPRYCTSESQHVTEPIYRLGHVYVCTRLVKVHVCLAQCEYAQAHLDSERRAVCPLTGLVCESFATHINEHSHNNMNDNAFGTTMSLQELKEVTNRQNNTFAFADLPVKELAERCMGFTGEQAVTEVQRIVFETNVCVQKCVQNGFFVPVQSNWQSAYLRVAVVIIASMLNLRKLRDRSRVDEALSRNVATHIGRYVNEHTRTNTHLNVYDIYMLINATGLSFQQSPYVYLSDHVLAKMIVQYAQRTVTLWYLMMTRTTFASDLQHAHRLYWDFTIASVLLFRDGFVYTRELKAQDRLAQRLARAVTGTAEHSRSTTEHMLVLTQDPFLQIAIPEKPDIFNATARGNNNNNTKRPRATSSSQQRTKHSQVHPIVPVTSPELAALRMTFDRHALQPHVPLDYEATRRQIHSKLQTAFRSKQVRVFFCVCVCDFFVQKKSVRLRRPPLPSRRILGNPIPVEWCPP